MLAELLDAGHDSAALMDSYSLDEVEAHYHALMRSRAKKRLEFITDQMTGSGMMNKNVRRKHIRSLASTAERIWHATRKKKKTPQERLFEDLKSLKARANNMENDDGNNEGLPDQHRRR